MITRPRVLITDDERDIRWALAALLRTQGFDPLEADTGGAALELLKRVPVDAMLLDLRMTGPDGIEVLREVKRFNCWLPVIFISGQGSIPTVVKAMKGGAVGFLTKPYQNDEVVSAIREAIRLKPETGTIELGSTGLKSNNPAIRRAIAGIARVAPTDLTVIVEGETGTGKEQVGRAIHQHSKRALGPFVPIDCGAVTPSLIESELFGHEKGSFTGADRAHIGTFEAANGGTVLLDEIHNLPLVTQAKLLRVLQEKQIRRVGASTPVKIDVRVIAVTNVDLTALIEEGLFRRDLYHRLNEFRVVLPPLRDRGDDLIVLSEQFVEEACEELGRVLQGLSSGAIVKLRAHHWRGNIRELRNVIRRSVLMADDVIRPEHLEIEEMPEDETVAPAQIGTSSGHALSSGVSMKSLLRKSQAATEREVVVEALRLSGGNKSRAARLLQVDSKTLRAKVKEYDLNPINRSEANEQESREGR